MKTTEWRAYIEAAIREALLGEVRTSPKPGLVDQIDNGAHADMNIHTFECSTEAIAPYLADMFMEGFAPAKNETEEKVLEIEELEDEASESEGNVGGTDCAADPGAEAAQAENSAAAPLEETEEEQLFRRIRRIGMEAEKAMFAATNGVNTHKGMIFTMGTVLAAAGLYLRRNYTEDDLIKMDADHIRRVRRMLTEREGENVETGGYVYDILWLCQDMCRRILNEEFREMETREPVTHGERLYREYGERGIRGQAEQGFPILREVAFPEMEKFRAPLADLRGGIRMHRHLWEEMQQDETPWESTVYLNAVYLQVLLRVMSELNDTNVVTRSSYEEMRQLQEESRKILSLGGGFTEQGMTALLSLNSSCIQRNISPGGAADILAAAILLWRLQEVCCGMLFV